MRHSHDPRDAPVVDGPQGAARSGAVEGVSGGARARDPEASAQQPAHQLADLDHPRRPGAGGGRLFLAISRRTAPTTSRALLQSGVSGSALVREVKSLTRNVGVKLPGLSATAGLVTCALTVTVQGREADVVHREFILGSDLRYL